MRPKHCSVAFRWSLDLKTLRHFAISSPLLFLCELHFFQLVVCFCQRKIKTNCLSVCLKIRSEMLKIVKNVKIIKLGKIFRKNFPRFPKNFLKNFLFPGSWKSGKRKTLVGTMPFPPTYKVYHFDTTWVYLNGKKY